MRIARDLSELVCDRCEKHTPETAAIEWLQLTRFFGVYGQWVEKHYCSPACLVEDMGACRG
jgi:hypothetical protein